MFYLDSGTSGIVETYDRSPYQQGLVHHLADLLRVRHGQGPAKHCEVLMRQFFLYYI